MPLVIVVHYQRPRGRWFGVWIPVLPVLLILSPLLLLGILVGVGAALYLNVRPGAALAGIGLVLWALRGTQIAINNGDRQFLLSFR